MLRHRGAYRGGKSCPQIHEYAGKNNYFSDESAHVVRLALSLEWSCWLIRNPKLMPKYSLLHHLPLPKIHPTGAPRGCCARGRGQPRLLPGIDTFVRISSLLTNGGRNAKRQRDRRWNTELFRRPKRVRYEIINSLRTLPLPSRFPVRTASTSALPEMRRNVAFQV